MKSKKIPYSLFIFIILLAGCEDRTYHHVGLEFAKEYERIYQKTGCEKIWFSQNSKGISISIFSFCENSIPFVSQQAYLLHKKYHITIHVELFKQSREEYVETFLKPKPAIEFIFR